MMKFKSFKASDEKGINEFLTRNEKYLGSNGAYVFENAVHFMWMEQTDDEAKRIAIVEKIKERLVTEETQIALQQVEVDHAREEAGHGTKGASANKVVEAQTVLDGLKRKSEATRKVMNQILAGEYNVY